MANYFKHFTKIPYYFDETNRSIDLITNITNKFKFDDNFKENTVLYYDYILSDGETPEVVSDKIYGSPEKHWLILMLNDIVHPQKDWPLDQRSLSKYIESKYLPYANTSIGQTGITWSKTNIKEYLLVEKKTIIPFEDFEEKIYVTSSNVYANTVNTTEVFILPGNYQVSIEKTKRTKSYYEYETELNESKRTIKLLKQEYVPVIEKEFKKLV